MNPPETKIVCVQCGKEMPDFEITSGFNIGFGPVYSCRQCHPPADAKTTLERMNRFIECAEKRPNT